MSRKTWNFPLYQTESLYRLLERVLEDVGDGSSALVLPDGKSLLVNALHPADTATLPVAALQCHQYLQLKDGDIAICNDPYTGGTRLSDITLVAAVSFESASDPCELLIAHRMSFSPRISLNGRLDDEGVRIPPMPLANGGRLNREILAAMAMAPLAPRGLAARIEDAVAGLGRARAALKACGKDPLSDLRKANFKRYLQDSKDAAQFLLHRLPLGETMVTCHLQSGELLKLRLEVVDDHVIFDFTGTEPSTKIQMTELATYGACFAAVEATLGRHLPANSGTFQLIEVHTPARTWVNAKAPAATSRGVSDGLAQVSSLALKAFGRLNQSHKHAGSAIGSSRLQFEFDDGSVFTDTTPGGTAAAKESSGLDGWNLWLHHDDLGHSVEEAERHHAIQIRSVVLRPSSGGKGKWSGGQGLVKSYTVLKPAQMAWALEQATAKPEGVDGGKAGMSAEVVVIRAGETEKEELESEGRIALKVGDTVRIFTAGGGGFAEPEDAS